MGIETLLFLAVLLFSVVIHEVSHGVAAYSMGDDTAKRLGRLTLNPLKHLDPFGSIILPFILIILQTPFIFGYAKPVPYNPFNLNDKKYGPAKVALAGPSSNLIIAFLFGMMVRLSTAGIIPVGPAVVNMFEGIVWINVLLAIFNLLPVPPLDGHWLVLTFLPNKFARFKLIFQQMGIFLFIILLFVVFPLIIPLIVLISELMIGKPLFM
jgi:Zn-dependent protease